MQLTEIKSSPPPATVSNPPACPVLRIGVYLKQRDWRIPNIASDRIRGEWVMMHCPEMEEWKPGAQYDAVIFHNLTPEIGCCAGLKILDVCDPMWQQDSTSKEHFKRMAASVDAIVAPTENMRRIVVELLPGKPSFVIGDGHFFPYYTVPRSKNEHSRKAEVVVWFGYAANATVLAPFLPQLQSLGLRLKLIAERNPFPQSGADFVTWNPGAWVREISAADFALLPPGAAHKSNNKDISALLCGIPVAKSTADVVRLIDPEERKKAMEAALPLIAQHNAKDRAQDYLVLINSILDARKRPQTIPASPKIEIYTAICGGYDRPRQDVHVLGDPDLDRFKEPVMNAKIYKLLPHLFTKSPYRVWVDGNIYLKRDPEILIQELLGDHDIVAYKHPWRNCLYAEHLAARNSVPVPYRSLFDEQVRQYRSEGMPVNFGLAECGVLISKDNAVTQAFFERWWTQVTRYSARDQVSFPYVWWKMQDKIRIRLIEASTRFGPHFEYRPHG